MTEYLKPEKRDDFPDKYEDAEKIVWRYMDDWKFIDLVKEKRLYLCRGDKLQDLFEGTYSRHQLLDTYRWMKEIGCAPLISQDKKDRQENRRRFYINSWCMYNHDLDLMWKSYTKVCHAVAVQSRVAKLVAICDSDPALEHGIFSVQEIKYIDLKEGEFINDFGTGFDAFICKDKHFFLDQEIRIIHYATWDPN
jgi:hypothetical protein